MKNRLISKITNSRHALYIMNYILCIILLSCADSKTGTTVPEFLSDVKEISAGDSHSVALRNDGTVWTWGRNYYCQLGTGDLLDRFTPVQILKDSNNEDFENVETVSVEHSHTAALKNGGTVWTWGNNYMGQLGDGTSGSGTNKSAPVQVKGEGGIGVLTGVKMVYAGGFWTIAVKNDDTVWAWGSNTQGQLGDGTTTNRSAPVQVKGEGGIGVLTDVKMVSGGWSHTVAVKDDGTVWAWGWNSGGKLLGGDIYEDSSIPVQVRGEGGVGFLTDVKMVSVGCDHTVAVKNDGTVWAWGYNIYGQLGDGTYTDSSVPVKVKGEGGAGFLTDVKMVATGDYCTVAIKNDGSLLAWGDNSCGQFGNNSRTDSPYPVKTGDRWVTVAAGGYQHTVAIKIDGVVWSWGSNSSGELGDGTDTDRYTPGRVIVSGW